VKIYRTEESLTAIADSASAPPGTQLAQTISSAMAAYRGPIETPVGRALWAIQAWYSELGDEAHAEELLEAGR
jgi:hypothetical protein